MKLHEYQSKRVFARYGVPIPQGDVATTPEEARRIAARAPRLQVDPTVAPDYCVVDGRPFPMTGSTYMARARLGGEVGWQRRRAWIDGFSSAEIT